QLLVRDPFRYAVAVHIEIAEAHEIVAKERIGLGSSKDAVAVRRRGRPPVLRFLIGKERAHILVRWREIGLRSRGEQQCSRTQQPRNEPAGHNIPQEISRRACGRKVAALLPNVGAYEAARNLCRFSGSGSSTRPERAPIQSSPSRNRTFSPITRIA